ncbi:MAG: hypothetical protein U1E73_06450 [Planctomycetota bacterium]
MRPRSAGLALAAPRTFGIVVEVDRDRVAFRCEPGAVPDPGDLLAAFDDTGFLAVIRVVRVDPDLAFGRLGTLRRGGPVRPDVHVAGR